MLLTSAVGVAAALAGASTIAVAATATEKPMAAVERPVAAVGQAADESLPPLAVEDFEYPGKAKILEERGITLHRGDGHIVLADCDDSANQIQVWTRQSSDGRFCFRATTTTGYLSLEVSEVFALQTEARAVRAELSAEGESQTVDVAKGEFKGVGEGVGDGPSVLLELRVTG